MGTDVTMNLEKFEKLLNSIVLSGDKFENEAKCFQHSLTTEGTDFFEAHIHLLSITTIMKSDYLEDGQGIYLNGLLNSALNNIFIHINSTLQALESSNKQIK